MYEEGTSTWTLLVANTRSTTTQYHHIGLDPGSTWYYRVSAINAIGAGEPSKVASASTDPVVPDPPTKLAATANGATRIDLTWLAPEYEGGARVTGYRIDVFEPGGAEWQVLVANTRSTSTDYAHTGLDPASTRTYRIAAINAAGTSDPSNMATATTDAVVPDPPTDLRAIANGTSQIDLDWRAPHYDGGARITGYSIEVSDNGGATWTTLIADTRSAATAFPHTGLRPATTRHYRVSAINRVGTGDPSNVAEATTDATVPDPPEQLVASAHDHSQIDLEWEAPPFDGGARITGYRIEVSENSGATWAELVATTGSAIASYAHTGLRPATTRHYRISAINEIGTGRASNVASATTDAIAPDPPTNLVATADAPTRIDLTWTAPAYDGGAPVTSYRIEVSEDAAEWTDLERSTGTNATWYSHTGLRPGSTRHYRVSAINVAGAGLPSGIASATTDDPIERAGRVNEAVLPHFAAAMTTSTLSAIAGRIEAVASRGTAPGELGAEGFLSLAGAAGRPGPDGRLTMGRLLDGASFAVPFQGGGGQQTGAGFGSGTWGGAEYHSMGEPGAEDVPWEGDMLTIHVGTDLRVRRDLLLGVAGSRSSGNYAFTDLTGAREIPGTYQAHMSSLNPYLAWLPGRAGVAVWAAAGLGWGEVEIDDEMAGERAGKMRMTMGALGGSRSLLSNGWSSFGLRAEGWTSRVEVKAAEEMDSLVLDMRRVRLALEWTQVHRFGGGHEAKLTLEGGMRYDNGDGTPGLGTELGAAFRYVSPSEALTMVGHGRVRQAGSSGYREWGIGGRIDINPEGRNRGLSLRLAPVWGDAASGVREMWEQGVTNRPGVDFPTGKGRLNAQVEYGLPTFGPTPYGRFQLARGGARALATGMRYKLIRVLDLRVEGTRTESGADPPRHRLALGGHWRF